MNLFLRRKRLYKGNIPVGPHMSTDIDRVNKYRLGQITVVLVSHNFGKKLSQGPRVYPGTSSSKPILNRRNLFIYSFIRFKDQATYLSTQNRKKNGKPKVCVRCFYAHIIFLQNVK